MEAKKKLRCPLGVPGGILAALIGLTGVVVNIINFNWFELITSLALLLLAMPFVRVMMMVHSANDRLDEIESKMNK
ncbi:MAG: hypothetical protein COW63_05795 [Bacteroidetes bacterium CG18_big_fil_WC_8_21_14_2_50_41_14]|nr:MAG: hypothetical protein COW63_05795 [Bacteroidetes bacterium CG18_big_fil_WC_8_21_14_2_50_41_14]PIY31870.1 MAG: hypothetical protein COZ08_08045 [Bacteroidetes bacterium CG_4_10_14_3_um_filter_42_6]PJB55047.1 MAG: hypothetical protein CO098_18415 [Bacteroidetes bacterium CG_4_9_14_3_um_filter_41_19]